MNRRQKEEYLREYSILKNEGKPFFPYAVAKDSLMGCVVIGVIIFLSIYFGAILGPKANAATTSYDPRPDWYFFFLFQLLRSSSPRTSPGLRRSGSRRWRWSCCSCCRSTTAALSAVQSAARSRRRQGSS